MNVNVPAEEGVPLIWPEVPFKVRPEGSAPSVMLQVMGAEPDAVTVAEYGVPTLPAGSGLLLVIEGAAVTVILNWADALPAAFDAWSVNVNVPAEEGVPLIWPDVILSARPAGSAPIGTLHVMGAEPEAVTVAEYGVPTLPAGSGLLLVIEGAAVTVILN